MIGQRIIIKRGQADEGEKPFWISFADLMTALMVLFLISLSIALLRAHEETAKAKQAQEELARATEELRRREQERDTRREQRLAEVSNFLDEIDRIVVKHPGLKLDRARQAINFGSRAQYGFSRHDLRLEQANDLRRFVPELLSIIRSETQHGRSWLKRVVVEGFTDTVGAYLYNLNLSLQRSQRVLCVLLADEWPTSTGVGRQPLPPGVAANLAETKKTPSPPVPSLTTDKSPLLPISVADKELIRSLFLVGGYSSNSQKSSAEESRRIELRLEFYQVDEDRAAEPLMTGDVGKCMIGH